MRGGTLERKNQGAGHAGGRGQTGGQACRSQVDEYPLSRCGHSSYRNGGLHSLRFHTSPSKIASTPEEHAGFGG